MTDNQQDAKFEDGGEAPLRLLAMDADDLGVISALVQDAVFPASEMAWDAPHRRFALLLNRFRWEDAPAAKRRARPVERVQSVLSVTDVLKVQSQGVERGDKDMILSLLSMSFTAGEDGMGRLELVLAGDGVIALDVETLDVTLQDVTRPYVAPSRHTPKHPE
ncbi:DUF2948 family protein [Aliiroseovarius sp. M344]|uniref:DUF2948 family protein n=1 Tax=Aliiroseovarius sp. M344 TaxID=2867010 RepID=UPI0021AD7ECA|nr:DUF2948 family protein [Aliiroseovarius sp. M344]UWQ13581.1 DUF2948 family protein [Aliiroseovarius sp. M344]